MEKSLFYLTIFIAIINLAGCAVVAIPVAATGVAVAQDRRTAGTILDDQAIELKAAHALAKNEKLWKNSHISTISYNNVALLVGQVPNEQFKKEAETAILNIPKIRQVHNEISIEKPAPITIRSQDSWITTQIKAKMLTIKEVNRARIKVITEKGVVYLMGITTPEEQAKATEIARSIAGVEKVIQIFENT